MGLFSRKKNKAQAALEAEAAAAERLAAQRRAAEQAATQLAAQQAAERKAKADREREKEDKIMSNTTAKRKQIEQLERAIKRFEEERAQEAGLALAAQKAKKKSEALRHAQKAKRLKDRIENYDHQLSMLNDQLVALENTGTNNNFIVQMKETTELMNEVKIDADVVSDTLQDMRESLQAAQDVQDTIKADANMYGPSADAEDLLDELAEEFETEVSIPDVPVENPVMPGPARVTSKTPAETEEDEMRRLEADIAL